MAVLISNLVLVLSCLSHANLELNTTNPVGVWSLLLVKFEIRFDIKFILLLEFSKLLCMLGSFNKYF